MHYDDNEPIRERLCDLIRGQGYRVEYRNGLYRVCDDKTRSSRCLCIRVKKTATYHKKTGRHEYGIDWLSFARLCDIDRRTPAAVLFYDATAREAYWGKVFELADAVRVWEAEDDADSTVFVPRDLLRLFARW